MTDGILSAYKDKYSTRQKRTKNHTISPKKIEYFSKKLIKKQLFPKKQPENSSLWSISDIIFRKIAFFQKIVPFMIRAFPKPPPKRAFVDTNRLFSAFLAYNPAIILYLYGQFKAIEHISILISNLLWQLPNVKSCLPNFRRFRPSSGRR